MTPTIAARRRALRWSLALSLVLAGCGSSAPPASPSADSGETVAPTAAASPTDRPTPRPTAAASPTELPLTGRIELTEHGYAVTLPDHWFRSDLDADGIRELMEAGADQLPEGMGGVMEGQLAQMAASGVSLFGFREADGEASIGTNVSIIALPAFGMSLEALGSLNVSQLKAMLGADVEIESREVDLPIGKAVQIQYAIPIGTEGLEVGTVQYLILTDKKQFVVSCGVAGDVTPIVSECDAIAASIELLS